MGADLLTPEGEEALYMLNGSGPKSMTALKQFLTERGFGPDWPMMDRHRDHESKDASRIKLGRGKGLNLDRAVEEADRQYAARTGKPVGDFSKKLTENIEAQEKGARLKGRRTL